MSAITPSLHVLEIPFVEPLIAFGPFSDETGVVFFDSAADAGGQGHFSYIATNPFKVLRTEFAGSADPFDMLSQELAQYNLPHNPNLPPFQTGAAGILSYEAGRHLEELPAPKKQGLCFPEMVIGFYDTVAAFDLRKRKAWVLASDVSNEVFDGKRQLPKVRAQKMAQQISSGAELRDLDLELCGHWKFEISKEEYEAELARVIKYIYTGDIFQANDT